MFPTLFFFFFAVGGARSSTCSKEYQFGKRLSKIRGLQSASCYFLMGYEIHVGVATTLFSLVKNNRKYQSALHMGG